MKELSKKEAIQLMSEIESNSVVKMKIMSHQTKTPCKIEILRNGFFINNLFNTKEKINNGAERIIDYIRSFGHGEFSVNSEQFSTANGDYVIR